MNEKQQCRCPTCGKPFAKAPADTLTTTPHHENAGKPCHGAGKSLRLVSVGFYAQRDCERNGKARKS